MKIGDLDFNDAPGAPDNAEAAAARAPDATVTGRFAACVVRHPDRPAVVCERATVSYRDLDAEARRIAGLIRRLGLPAEARVGLLLGRSWRFIAALLGVMRAGCAYVPLDPALPLSRRRQMVDGAAMPLIVGETATLGDLHRLQWACPTVRDILCLDTESLDSRTEAEGALMSAELWDHLAGADGGGTDIGDVLAGGWKSAFTGAPYTPAAMTAFGDNARRKVAPLLPADGSGRVLEIGCASGFTMRHLAPLCGHYLATDIARRNVERVEGYARAHDLAHVSGQPLAAHDIDVLEPATFDVIVLNSVIESFPGFGYLRQVLDKATRLLAPGGALFLGNVWDLDRRDGYMADLRAFARANAGKDLRTRLDAPQDLFVPRAFLDDWAAERGDTAVSVSALEAEGFEPAAYTFDAVVRPGARTGTAAPTRRRHDRSTLTDDADDRDDARPDALAYVIFTSGTTGAPKGAMIEHRSVVGLADAVNATQLAHWPDGGARVGSVLSFAFDGSVAQIMPALLGGHTLHIADDDARHDPARLQAFLEARRPDHHEATPSLFTMLLDHWERTGTIDPARAIVLGGEAVSPDIPRRFFAIAAHRDTRLFNGYGPTECTVSAAQHPMTAATWAERLPPPVGPARPGARVRVCDTAGRPVPPGVVGEIRIGGGAVGRGYLDDPARTAERFVTDADGARWYRTGDLGRLWPDGALAVLGREDGQVKIRGNRIELGEVEAALLAHPLVAQAAVLAPETEAGSDRVLVGYVVAHPGFDAGACRADLEARLPAVMVPSRLIELEALPLGPTGKLDPARLPSSSRAADTPATFGRAPKTEAEQRIAAIMGAVLDKPVQDAEADFFDLGGHSVLAVRLVTDLDRAFGVRLPLADLFAGASVAALAVALDRQSNAGADAGRNRVVCLNDQGARVPLVCFHPVGGNVLCYQRLAADLGPDQPVLMVEAEGLREGETPPPADVGAMVAAALPHIRAALDGRAAHLAGWSFGGLLAHEAARQLRAVGEAVQSLMVFDAVANPEPVRALLRKGEAAYLADLFSEVGMGDADALRAMTPDERLDALATGMGRSDLFPDGADRDTMRRLLAVFQANGLAAVRHVPSRLPGLDVLLVRPRQPSRMAPGLPGDDYNGWREVVDGTVHLVWMEGTHGTMLEPPHVSELAAHVRAYIHGGRG